VGVADDLYALPPDEFTRARNERAKALRKEGKREEADAVKELRKPTVAAWALNQLARRRAKGVERLLAAGEELRAAQEELLAGGDRKAFQSAATKERDEVAGLTDEAAELAAEAGERPTPALREKISETLHAAALDEETGEELRAGRLVRERAAIGGFGGMTAAPPARGRERKAPKESKAGSSGDARERRASNGGKAPGSGAKRGKASDDGAKRRADAERRKTAERRAEAERRQRLAAARTDERHARRELVAAEKATEHAETRAEAARVHAEEATARAKTTAERLKEARRERTAAKKAHARAERALAEAERGS
jgi:hypothetical protein